MSSSVRKYAVIVIMLCCQINVFGQYQIGLIPRSSPDRSVSKTIGTTDVTITYGSPSVSNRVVWGDLVPYDQIWRAGANNATTLEVSDDIIINGTVIAQGRYALFILPKKHDKWTVILNADADQWGAFRYDKSKDVIRVDVSPRKAAEHVEELSYKIEHHGFQYGKIVMEWEHMEVELEFGTDYIEKFIKEVEARAAKADVNVKWVVYLQGAEHLVNLNLKPEVASQWLAKSEDAALSIVEWNAQFYPKEYIHAHRRWTLAKLYAAQGKYSEALIEAQEARSLGARQLYYNRKGGSEKMDELIAEWQSVND